MKREIRIGTRDSKLAQNQSYFVKNWLEKLHVDVKFEMVKMSTIGDKILDKPLAKIGEKNLFTKELEEALASDRIDIIVHCLKDLPTTLDSKFQIGAILKRASPCDVVILRKDLHGTCESLKDLPEKSVVGTSSLRRVAQLQKNYPHLLTENIRGNLNTRFRKLDEAEKRYDAIVLAHAGVERMGWEDRISFPLKPEDSFYYAVGQGALAIEVRGNDNEVIDLVRPLSDENTLLTTVAERCFLKTLEGGCSTPVGVVSNLFHDEASEDLKLTLKGRVLNLDGSVSVDGSLTRSLEALNSSSEFMKRKKCDFTSIDPGISQNYDRFFLAASIGIDLATELLSKGAKELLVQSKKTVAEQIEKNPLSNPKINRGTDGYNLQNNGHSTVVSPS